MFFWLIPAVYIIVILISSNEQKNEHYLSFTGILGLCVINYTTKEQPFMWLVVNLILFLVVMFRIYHSKVVKMRSSTPSILGWILVVVTVILAGNCRSTLEFLSLVMVIIFVERIVYLKNRTQCK